MNSKLKTIQIHESLEQDIQKLYFKTKAKVGEKDLEHIRKVAAYSQALKQRSQELIQQNKSTQSWSRGVILGALHTLLEFSELGHNILHGSYDHLNDSGEFHSARWKWDFVTDTSEWKTMHHQNHHPFTNIVGKDHDLGYTLLRMMPGQNWYIHNVLQPLVFASLLVFPSYYFTFFTAASAAHTRGNKILHKATFEKSLALIKDHILESYIQPSLNLPFKQIVPTLIGNYLVTVLGYAFTIHILLLEHHADNTMVYSEQEETKDDYYRRQILSTTNFKPNHVIDTYLKKILNEEVDFTNPPDFEIFYGGLATHLEHHLFPDLPCNRQREVREKVKKICAKHGLPYNIVEFDHAVSYIYKSVFKLGLPLGEKSEVQGLNLFKKSKKILDRMSNGVFYKNVQSYFKGGIKQEIGVSIQKVTILQKELSSCGRISYLNIEKTKDWQQYQYAAGAYVSLGRIIRNKMIVRQYSVVDENSKYFKIAVKRQDQGVFSNFIASEANVGTELDFFHPPKNSEGFDLTYHQQNILFLVGGIGITPIMNMLLSLSTSKSKAAIHLVYFNHDDRHIPYKQEIAQFAEKLNLRVHFICSQIKNSCTDVSQGRLNPEIFNELKIDVVNQDIYICAPIGFIAAAKEILSAHGVDPDRIHTENFDSKLGEFQDDGQQHVIQFSKSGKTIQVAGNVTLLEAAERAGLNVPSGCKQGLCKACVCIKTEGTTQLEQVNQIELNSITLCNTVARSDTIILDL